MERDSGRWEQSRPRGAAGASMASHNAHARSSSWRRAVTASQDPLQREMVIIISESQSVSGHSRH